MNPTDQITAIPALPNQTGKTNVPGARRLWLIETRHVGGLIDPRTVSGALANGWSLTETGLQLIEDAVIQAFQFPADRCVYDQKATVTVQGVIYAQALTMAVPKDHPLTALVAQRMTGRKWVAIYEDANGLRKVIGTPKQPLRFLAQVKNWPNEYGFGWAAETRYPAYFFSDNALLDLLRAEAEFSYGFSYDFFS